jgi:hypothetical protein
MCYYYYFYYASSCLHRKKSQQDDNKEQHVKVAFEANAYHTYQVNAIGYHGFKRTEVLLDNQADIVIMRPGLLHNVQKAEQNMYN